MRQNKLFSVLLMCFSVVFASTGWARGSRGSSTETFPTPMTSGKSSCWQENPYNGEVACIEYTGDRWTEPLAREDCQQMIADSALVGHFATFGCLSVKSAMGACTLDGGTGSELTIYVYASEFNEDELTYVCEVLAHGRYTTLMDPSSPRV